MERSEEDIDDVDKAIIITIMLVICGVGAGLSMWAVQPLEGYERPAFMCATAFYGFVCMMGGVALSFVQKQRD
jgi:hypothetical protein